jgi:hypothetical protein
MFKIMKSKASNQFIAVIRKPNTRKGALVCLLYDSLDFDILGDWGDHIRLKRKPTENEFKNDPHFDSWSWSPVSWED